MPSRTPVKTTKVPPSAEENDRLTVLLDEVKSVADVLRSIQTELFWLKSSVASRSDLEVVKTELRLVRSDIGTFDKKLSGAKAKPPA